MRFGYYLNHICFHSLPWGAYDLLRPLSRMLTKKFVLENQRADNVLIFNFADCAEKCLGWPWWSPAASSNELVRLVSMYTCCALYGKLMAVYRDMVILTSNCTLVFIVAASCLTANFKMSIPGYSLGGCIGSIAEDYLVSGSSLGATEWWIGRKARRSARIGSDLTWQRCLCRYELLVWNRRGRK